MHETLLLVVLCTCLQVGNSFFRPAFTPLPCKQCQRSRLQMAFDTIVSVKSKFEAKCGMEADEGVSLSDYMKLPVEQYVCIQMPLNASLERIGGSKFNLTVPPVRFFHLDVSPMLYCDVTQTEDSVSISSSQCILRGSPYVVGLNGCFKIDIQSCFQWKDTPDYRAILSQSRIYVEVDPPSPFKFFGRRILQNTGSLAMSIALRQIENAFVQSLARDYYRWANDVEYRRQRAGMTSPSSSPSALSVSPPAALPVLDNEPQTPSTAEEVSDEAEEAAVDILTRSVQEAIAAEEKAEEKGEKEEVNSTINAASETPETVLATKDSSIAVESDLSPSSPTPLTPSLPKPNASLSLPYKTGSQPPPSLSDDFCLLPGGEPEVLIECAPQNARRIYTGVDIAADLESVWEVLTDYERLHYVVPSLVSNEVLSRDGQGGARLSQIGGAKVFPGLTFKAKTVLDVKTYKENNPLPPNMFIPYDKDQQSSPPIQRGVFPRPYAETALPHRDITMQNVQGEGDFDHYQGVWRIQSLPSCFYEDNKPVTRLSYAVEIKPKGFLPVNLIEGRIAMDLKTNVDAIRCYVEKNRKQKREEENREIEAERAILAEQKEEIVSMSVEEENQVLKEKVSKLEGELKEMKSVLEQIRSIMQTEQLAA